MVTGEWLDSWTCVIFLSFFSWPKASAKRARSPRLSRIACLLLHAFLLRSPKKANKLAPVLHVSEWYPFLTCSEESLCIKVDPECGVLNVNKKAGTFTSDYFCWKGFAVKRRSESTRPRTQGNTCVYAKLPKTEKNFNFQKYPDTCRRGLVSVSQLRRGVQ